MQDNKAEHAAETRAVCQVPEDTMTEKNQSGCLVLSRTTLGGVRGGSNAAGRQVIQIAARFARTRRKRLSSPRSQTDVPGFPGVGLLDSGHATGWIWLVRSSYSIGVSMPGDK
jgi:hypothetical protein